MQVTHGAVVAMNYTLKDDEGELIDSSRDPLMYLHGYGNIIPGLEEALEGAEPGQRHTVTVEPAEAYGETDPGAIITVPSETVPEGVELTPGMVVVGDTPSGPVQLTVVEVNEDNIVVDGNHPLAGKRLHFDVEVVDVRAASEEELAGGRPQRFWAGDQGGAGLPTLNAQPPGPDGQHAGTARAPSRCPILRR